MRKVLSFVLVLAMVLGCVSMAFAANVSDVKGTKYETAVNALTELGVISGYTDGTYKPENQVTRAQFVALLVKALGYKPVKTATPFKDVPADNQYSGYIAVAYTLGITGGKTKDTFAPNDPVTYNQAIAFIVRGLGYTNEALASMQGTYSYPLSEIVKAQEIGMFDTCTTTGNTPATRGDYALFLYDVLDAGLVEVGMTGSVKSWSVSTNKSLLTRLNVEPTTAAGIVYNGSNLTAVDGFNMTPYIGKCIVAYTITKAGDNFNKVIAVKEVKSTTLVGKLNAAKDTLTVGSTKYTVDPAHVTSGKTFTNTDNTATFAAIADTTYTFEVKLSGKQVADIYSISKWTAENGIASRPVVAADLTKLNAEKDNKQLCGKKLPTNNNYEIDTTKFELVGVDSLADIKKDHIISVYCAHGEIVKVEVGTAVVKGQVTRLDGKKYTINGTQYSTVGDAAVDNLAVGNTVKAYLNADGKIAKATLVSGTAKTLAVVLDAADGVKANWATGTDAKAAKVKLYNLADGTVKDVELVSDGKVAYKTGDNTNKITTTYGAILTKGAVIKYDLDADDKLCVATKAGTFATATAITKNGYVGNYKIADDAIVVAVDETYADVSSAAGYKFENVTTSAFDADFKLTKKANVLDVTGKNVAYMMDGTTGYINLLFIADSATASTDKTYKTISGTGSKVVNGKAVTWVSYLGDDTEYETAETSIVKDKLYEVSFTTAGKAVLTGKDKTAVATYTTGDAVTSYSATYFAFVLNENGVKAVAANADVDAEHTTTKYAFTADTTFLKWNATKGYYELGSKTDLETKLTKAEFYATTKGENYITFVLYKLY